MTLSSIRRRVPLTLRPARAHSDNGALAIGLLSYGTPFRLERRRRDPSPNRRIISLVLTPFRCFAGSSTSAMEGMISVLPPTASVEIWFSRGRTSPCRRNWMSVRSMRKFRDGPTVTTSRGTFNNTSPRKTHPAPSLQRVIRADTSQATTTFSIASTVTIAAITAKHSLVIL